MSYQPNGMRDFFSEFVGKSIIIHTHTDYRIEGILVFNDSQWLILENAFFYVRETTLKSVIKRVWISKTTVEFWHVGGGLEDINLDN